MPFPLGAIFAGDPVGRYQETSQKGMKAMQEQLDEQSAALFGKSLQQLFQSATPGATAMPPGGVAPVPGVGGQGQQPTAPNLAAVSQPPAPGAVPAPSGAPAGSIVPSRPGQPTSIMGGGGPPPSGSVGSQGGQEGGGQQPQATGPLTLQQVVQSVIKSAGPKANPQVIAGAIQKYLPLMNAQSQQQAREMLNNYREQGLLIREQDAATRQQAEQRKQQEQQDREQRFAKQDQQSAIKLQALIARFDNAVRNRKVDEAKNELAEFDRLIGERNALARDSGITFKPDEVDAMLRKRKELQAAVDALRQQPAASFNDRFAPPDSGAPKGPAAPGGRQTVPYAPPQ